MAGGKQSYSRPFVIGVLRVKPFPEYLARIAMTKKVQNRPIAIRRYKAGSEVGGCHLLYVPSAVTQEEEQAALRKVGPQPGACRDRTPFRERQQWHYI